jgi:hypothetical protein
MTNKKQIAQPSDTDILATLRRARSVLAESWAERSLDENGFHAADAFRAVAFTLDDALQRSAPCELDRDGKPNKDDRYWAALRGAQKAIRRVWAVRPERLEYDSLRDWEIEHGRDGVIELVDAAIGT